MRFATLLALVALSIAAPSAHARPQAVKIAWVAIEGAESYDVEVATSAAMDKVVKRDSVATTSLTITLEPGQYFYRVRGKLGQEVGPWSDVAPIEVAESGAVASDIHPAPDAVVVYEDLPNGVLAFKWPAPAAPTRRQAVEITGPGGKTYRLEAKQGPFARWKVPAGGTYAWRVWQQPETGKGAWSPKRQFVVAQTQGEEEPREPYDRISISAFVASRSYVGDFGGSETGAEGSTRGAGAQASFVTDDNAPGGEWGFRHEGVVRLGGHGLFGANATVYGARARTGWTRSIGDFQVGPGISAGLAREPVFGVDRDGAVSADGFLAASLMPELTFVARPGQKSRVALDVGYRLGIPLGSPAFAATKPKGGSGLAARLSTSLPVVGRWSVESAFEYLGTSKFTWDPAQGQARQESLESKGWTFYLGVGWELP